MFIRVMNRAISKGLRSLKPVQVRGELRSEVEHWLFLESWDNPIPWKDERHVQVSVASDASKSGWGGVMISPLISAGRIADYWTEEENHT